MDIKYTKPLRLLIILIAFGVTLGASNSYCQKIPKINTHTITVKTDDGYAKANILDHSKKKTNLKEYRMYFWFFNEAIHFSNGGYSGKLLHEKYTEYYNSDNIKEQGIYYYGLKTGYWKKWYTNGILNTVANYKYGIKNGSYREYDEKGNLKLLAKYRKGQIHGNYFLYKDGKIIIKKHFKNGIEVVPKEAKEKKSKKEKEIKVKPEDKPEKKEHFLKRGWGKIFKREGDTRNKN